MRNRSGYRIAMEKTKSLAIRTRDVPPHAGRNRAAPVCIFSLLSILSAINHQKFCWYEPMLQGKPFDVKNTSLLLLYQELMY
jgi:hypothetical protein